MASSALEEDVRGTARVGKGTRSTSPVRGVGSDGIWPPAPAGLRPGSGTEVCSPGASLRGLLTFLAGALLGATAVCGAFILGWCCMTGASKLERLDTGWREPTCSSAGASVCEKGMP